jgi:AraC-like DNA-binding protein
MIRFGLWSTILLVGSVHGVIVGLLLLRAARNRVANRFLAVLLFVVVLLITPFTLGYAGFYDAYPWLLFAPFFWQLGFGPLLYFYVRTLAGRSLPKYWALHFIPVALQGLYYTVAFCLPYARKLSWNANGHTHVVLPIQAALAIASFAIYWLASARFYRRYQGWLENSRGDREEFRLPWMRNFLLAVLLALMLDLFTRLYDATVHALSYADQFPTYLGFAVLVYYLGIEGWRHAGVAYPGMDEAAVIAPNPETPAVTEAPSVIDWQDRGERWRGQIDQGQWWRETNLSLATVASRLATNSHYLSRALNEGLGQTFSECVNRLRIAEAKRLLTDDGEVLAIAIEVGFGSKASFNRAFRDFVGCTPSAYRIAANKARLIS